MLATFHGHTDAVAELIVAGADIIATDDRGYGRYRQAICVRSRKRKRMGRLTAENIAVRCGKSEEYAEAVRKVRSKVRCSRAALERFSACVGVRLAVRLRAVCRLQSVEPRSSTSVPLACNDDEQCACVCVRVCVHPRFGVRPAQASQRTDLLRRKPYYFNERTHETRWDHPSAQQAPPPPAAVHPSPDSLPRGWRELRTAEGRVYYVNDDTTETRWDAPPGFVPRPQRYPAAFAHLALDG
jgi:hypothetical protein